jgi:hypothetical protein
MDRRLIQEINRLFDELVHHPWSRVPSTPAPITRSTSSTTSPAALIIEIPLEDAKLGSVGVELEGQRVTVVVTTRASQVRDPSASGALQESRQTFALPAGTQAGGFEARIDGNTLRVRIALRSELERFR